MKKRYWITAIFVLTIAAPVLLTAHLENIPINNINVFRKKSRSPVLFTHMNHMAMEGIFCFDCHHRFENGKNVLDLNELTEENSSIFCSNCHKGKSELEKAYHRQCIGCHDNLNKGPRMCGECHKWNK